jgi:ABC-type sugar transport system substrate-binding protein
MHKARLGFTLAASAAVIAMLAAAPAQAQERKSIRWATSSVDSYG